MAEDAEQASLSSAGGGDSPRPTEPPPWPWEVGIKVRRASEGSVVGRACSAGRGGPAKVSKRLLGLREESGAPPELWRAIFDFPEEAAKPRRPGEDLRNDSDKVAPRARGANKCVGSLEVVGCDSSVGHLRSDIQHWVRWTIQNLHQETGASKRVKHNGRLIRPGQALTSPSFRIFDAEASLRFWPSGFYGFSQRQLRDDFDIDHTREPVESWCAVALFLPRGFHLRLRFFVGDVQSDTRDCFWGDGCSVQQLWAPHATEPHTRLSGLSVGVQVLCNMASDPCRFRKPFRVSPCAPPTRCSPSAHPAGLRDPRCAKDVRTRRGRAACEGESSLKQELCPQRPASAGPLGQRQRPTSARGSAMPRTPTQLHHRFVGAKGPSPDMQRPASASKHRATAGGPGWPRHAWRGRNMLGSKEAKANVGKEQAEGEQVAKERLQEMMITGAGAGAWKYAIDDYLSARLTTAEFDLPFDA